MVRYIKTKFCFFSNLVLELIKNIKKPKRNSFGLGILVQLKCLNKI